MKLPKLTFPFILLLIVLIFNQCKKNPVNSNTDDGLPPVTQTGANIFACKVNGQNWISKTGSLNLGGGINNDTLSLFGSNPKDTTSYELYLLRINHFNSGTNEYFFLDTMNCYAMYRTNKPCFDIVGGGSVGFGKCYEGKLDLIKIDTINKVLSGQFWFNIKTDYCDTLKITNGRFDIRYY